MEQFNVNETWPRLSTDHTNYIWWLFHIRTVHSTNPLELHGDAHDRYKPIKTEPRPELANDIHGSHEMKSSVIRIPHEYGWVTRRHTHFERRTKCFISFSVCCSASPLTLYGSGGQRLPLQQIHICSCWDFFFFLSSGGVQRWGRSIVYSDVISWYQYQNNPLFLIRQCNGSQTIGVIAGHTCHLILFCNSWTCPVQIQPVTFVTCSFPIYIFYGVTLYLCLSQRNLAFKF